MTATATTELDRTVEPDDRPVLDRLQQALDSGERPEAPGAVSASLTFGRRALLKIKHVPEQLFDVTLFPIIMTLLFTGLFGGALAGSATEFVQGFLPGVLVMSILMISMYTGIAVSTDMEKGIHDRFRTLAIWRPAPMVGYLLGDAVRYAIASVVIIAVGLVLGFRPEGGVGGVVAGCLLVVGFSFAFSWLWTALGTVMRGEKALQGASMALLMPLTFLSNIFVDPETMPSWLEAFAEANPISHVVTATRQLMDGQSAAGELGIVAAVSAGLIVVFGSATMALINRR